MQKNAVILYHFPEAECNPGGAAEDEGINDSHIGGEFPEEQKKEQDGKAGNIDDPAVFSATVQIILLTGREFIHFDSAPPI